MTPYARVNLVLELRAAGLLSDRMAAKLLNMADPKDAQAYDPYSGYPLYQSGVGSSSPPAKSKPHKYGDARPNQGCLKCGVKGHIRVSKVDSDGVHLLCKLCGKELLEVLK